MWTDAGRTRGIGSLDPRGSGVSDVVGVAPHRAISIDGINGSGANAERVPRVEPQKILLFSYVVVVVAAVFAILVSFLV